MKKYDKDNVCGIAVDRFLVEGVDHFSSLPFASVEITVSRIPTLQNRRG